MSSYIGAALRRQVAERADFRCEYCLIRQADAYYGCEVDHITSEKHGGETTLDNLAYSCALCNRAKGTDLATIDHGTGSLVRLYHPRNDTWEEHFAVDGVFIRPLTNVGQATIRLLEINRSDRIAERQAILDSQA